MQLDNNNHSVFLLNYHLILVTKYRRKVIDVINAYKSASSRLIKKEFPQIREKLWKEYFWSRSFCLISTGGATVEVIQSYIQSQGMKEHGKKRKERGQSK